MYCSLRCIALLVLCANAIRYHKETSTGGKVVTLGDSYSSGTGIHKSINDYEGGDCCRDHKTIPGAQYATAQGLQSVNIACAGGQLPEIRSQFGQLQATYPADVGAGWKDSVIVFTIGGNDIRTVKGQPWTELLTECILSVYGACHEKAENQIANFDAVEADLIAFYSTVARTASNASIRILGYPRMMTKGWGLCISVPGLNGGTAHWADRNIDELNARLSRAVISVKHLHSDVDIKFVDVSNHLTKGACQSWRNHVHALVFADGGLSPMTFHPTQRGYNEYYQALGKSLGRSLPPSQVSPGEPEPWQLEKILDGWDVEKDGQLDIGEVLNMGGDDASPKMSKLLRASFREADKDSDGFLKLAEFRDFMEIIDREVPVEAETSSSAVDFSSSGGKVVTLGDSYSSGTGIHKSINDYEGGDCCRDHKTIPGAQYATSQGLQSVNIACAGGQLPEIRSQFQELQATYAADVGAGWRNSVIVFTIGGNDIRTAKGQPWTELLTDCITSVYGACHEKAENQIANFDSVEADLVAFYSTVAQAAPNASIRILGYPRLLTKGWGLCISVPGLNGGTAHWADRNVNELNARLSRAVATVKSQHSAVDIKFVDIANYLTRGACQSRGNHVHGIVLADGGLSPMTFHPTQRGYNEYYRALGKSLGRSLPPSLVPPGSDEPWQVDKILDGWDKDSDGKLNLIEVLNMGAGLTDPAISELLRSSFSAADRDLDGFLSLAEFIDFMGIVDEEESSADAVVVRSKVGGKVVTLGDSYSSGTGIHKSINDYEGGDCCRDHKTIPGAQYATSQGLQSVNIACAGGQLPEIRSQFQELQATYAADVGAGWKNSVIVFTIGGNDIRTAKGQPWTELLTDCITSVYGACHEKAENQIANFDSVEADLVAFYSTVAQAAPNASIRILGYPRLLTKGWGLCISVPGLNGGTAHWADRNVNELNARLSRAVAAVKSQHSAVDIKFVDIANYLTKGACQSWRNHVHGIVLADGGLSPMTFHPTQRGYNEYYRALGKSLGRSLPPSMVPPGADEPWQVDHILAGWDVDKDGKLDMGEVLHMGGDDADLVVSKLLRSSFHQADKDQDGFLSLAEFIDFMGIVDGSEQRADE